MAKIANTNTETQERDTAGSSSATLTKIARASEQSRQAAGTATARAHDMASGAAEDSRQTLRRSAGETAEVGQTVLDLLAEQARHNLHAAAAIGQAVDWAEVAKAQRELVGGTFERMNHFAERYRMWQAGMAAMSFPGRR